MPEVKLEDLNLCTYCRKGNLFRKMVDNTGKKSLECITCGHLSSYEDIFGVKKEKEEINKEEKDEKKKGRIF